MFLPAKMYYVFSVMGMIAALAMIKYREQLGNMIGDAEWMSKVGGVYNLVIIIAILVFFWSVAALTGTMDIFFLPILWLIPGVNTQLQ